MREEYVKETRIFDLPEKEHKQNLLEELENSKKRLQGFHENMNFAQERFSRLLYLSNQSRRG